MTPIHFTSHSLEKLSLTQRHGFDVDQETVRMVIHSPLEVTQGYSGRLIAHGILDEEHVLRVVYEDGEIITVVTLYPGRRQRYES